MSRNLTAQDRSSLIRLASTLPAGSAERKAILAGLGKVAYGLGMSHDDLIDVEGYREPLSVDVVADAIFLQSDRRRGQSVSRDELFGIAMKELSRYGHPGRNVERFLDGAIASMVKSRDLIPNNDAYLGELYRFPR
jgi:hypothetical protein